MIARNMLLSTVLVVAAATGCSSPNARFYNLASTATAGQGPPATYAVGVGPVTVPAAVDRSQFVVQVSPNRVTLDEFNRWASPLADGIARTVALDLERLLGTPNVAPLPLANFRHAYRVTIDVLRFDSIQNDSVLIDAVWSVRDTAGGRLGAGRTLARESVPGQGFEALAAAHSRALGKVSREIAAVIRAEAAGLLHRPVM